MTRRNRIEGSERAGQSVTRYSSEGRECAHFQRIRRGFSEDKSARHVHGPRRQSTRHAHPIGELRQLEVAAELLAFAPGTAGKQAPIGGKHGSEGGDGSEGGGEDVPVPLGAEQL